MRRAREKIKENDKAKIYVPFTFEGTMAAFGRSLKRDELQRELDESQKEFSRKIRNLNTTNKDIEKIV